MKFIFITLLLFSIPNLAFSEAPTSGCYKGTVSNSNYNFPVALSLSAPSSRGTIAGTFKNSFYDEINQIRFFPRNGSSYLSAKFDTLTHCDSTDIQIKRNDSRVIELRLTEYFCSCAGGHCFKTQLKSKANLYKIKKTRPCNL